MTTDLTGLMFVYLFISGGKGIPEENSTPSNLTMAPARINTTPCPCLPQRFTLKDSQREPSHVSAFPAKGVGSGHASSRRAEPPPEGRPGVKVRGAPSSALTPRVLHPAALQVFRGRRGAAANHGALPLFLLRISVSSSSSTSHDPAAPGTRTPGGGGTEEQHVHGPR